jgi:hypothetical protein
LGSGSGVWRSEGVGWKGVEGMGRREGRWWTGGEEKSWWGRGEGRGG